MNNRVKAGFFLLVIAVFFTGISPAVYAAAVELPDFTKLVEQISPAVVNISTSQKIKQDDRSMPPHGSMPEAPFDDFFRRFFGDEGDGFREYDSKSLGSGVVISKDGYVLTNSHVVRDADEIVVRLIDRREFVAEVIGMDKRSDVALLKIDADNLPVARIGKSGELKVGEWVLAIGSPFGFDYTVTAGIVSAKERSLPNENYVPFIQTDVAINPGNSGGPLFSLDGEVVGVNSQIYSRTGGFMGLSFAIPIDVAMNVVEQLKNNGQVTRGWLGILIQDVTRELAESFGMPKPAGALVARILPDSPASKADIHVGDVITEFNGKEVISSSSLPPMVGVINVGEKVDVKILRDGKTITKKVVIGELPQDDDIALAGIEGDGGKDVKIKQLEISVADLDVEQREQLEEGVTGVYVEQVGNGPASRAGLRKGDIILMVNNGNIEDTKHLKEVVDGLPADKSVPVLVQRRGGPIFLALKITEE